MTTKKQGFRKVTRMIIAFICCFPVLLVVSALLNGAADWLVFLINMVVGGTILFLTYLIGSKNDEKRERLHREHLLEIENRKKLERVTKGNYKNSEKDD